MENKLMKLDIEDLKSDHYVEILDGTIKKIGGIKDFIISSKIINGRTIAIAEITNYYLLLILYPTKFVDKIDKKLLINKLDKSVDIHKFANIFEIGDKK